MRPLATAAAWSVLLSVGQNCEPNKDGPTDRDGIWVTDSGGANEPRVKCGGVRIPAGERVILGVVSSLKRIDCVSSKKPQHGTADMSAGVSTSHRKRGFRIDSPAAGLADKCGGDAAFRRNSLTTCYCHRYRCYSSCCQTHSVWQFLNQSSAATDRPA